MTTRNSILLIIKQNQGIEYNSLLNKIASSYGSLNSARAALSRAKKDLLALGMIQKKDSNIFITAKGVASISGEMKGKLLVKLNKLVSSQKNYENIDSIVSDLATLIQRSKEDPDLLKTARGSADFSIAELKQLRKGLGTRLSHLSYLENVFSGQVEQLQELNFNDERNLSLDEPALKAISKIPEKTGTETITVEASSEEIKSIKKSFPEAASRQNSISLKAVSLKKLLVICKNKDIDADIYAGSLKIVKHGYKLKVTGPFKLIEKVF